MRITYWLITGACVFLAACAGVSPLNSVSPLPVPTAPETNVTVVVDYAQAAPVLGLVTSADFIVVGMEAGSAAELAHVQIGDQLLAFDEVTLRDAESVAKAMGKIPQAQPIRLTLLRAGERIEVTITPQSPSFYMGKVTATPMPSNLRYL